MICPLTTQKIRALKPKEKRFTITDGYGLTLRVHPSGSKTWVVRLPFQGRTADVKIGTWPEMSLKSARQEARRRRKSIGLTPPRGYVLRDAFILWKALKKGRIVSYESEKRRLEQFVMKPLGSRQIDEITAPVVIQCLRHLDISGKRVTLKRLLMRLREILDLAVCAGYIQHNPIERISRIFAPPIVTPMASVNWQSLPSVMKTIASTSKHVQLLFAWQLLTMLRPGEACKVKWDWIKDDVLSIPAPEMKKRRLHRVPITSTMHHVLKAIKSDSPHPRSGFVFPAKNNGSKHINSQTLAKAMIKTSLAGKLVPHGLRSIARSWLADHQAPFEAAESCLAHVAGSGTSRAYQRSDYLDQRTQLMHDWSNFVCNCARSAEFLPQILFN